jgi:NodT family efflux transporter outer membrane factor (OMF) lipoprotein
VPIPCGRGPVRVVRLVLVWGALVLQGCTTLGPDFEEPGVAWLAAWQPDLYGQIEAPGQQAATDLRFWWRVFEDPVLDALIEKARLANPTLRSAGLRVLESRARLGIAESNLYPQLRQLGADAALTHTRQRGGARGNQDDSLVTYRLGFDLGWELDFWGRFRRGVESADAAFFASVANQRDGQVLLAAQVAETYFSYRTLQLRIRIARENAEIQKRSFEITRKLYASGERSELDLQQARTQYLATLATIPDLQLSLTRTRNALAALLGRPPGELPGLDRGSPDLPRLQPVLIRAIPAGLLLRRPDVRSAAWQAAAQSARIGIAEADFYPAISLFGTVGWSGNTLSATPDTGTLAIGPSITWNILDQGAIANSVRVEDARLQQLLEQYQATVIQAAREIDDAAVGVVKTAEQQGTLRQALEAARRSLDLANTRYQEGYADFQRVLDAQRALFSQAERELVVRGSHVNAVIGLYKALGGGWLDMPVRQMIPAETRETMRRRTDWGRLLDDPPAADGREVPRQGRAAE